MRLPKARITLDLDQDLLQWVMEEAARTGKSRNRIIGDAVKAKKEANKVTIAMRIAEMLDFDGECWETDDGRDLDALAGEADAETTFDRERELKRYLFPDGSAIVAGVGGWDIEGEEPFSWAGAE